MSTEIKKIAAATKLGVDIRENSWDKVTNEYTIDSRDAFVQAAKQIGIDEKYAELLDLANYWPNDLDDWCNEVLS